MTEQMMPMHFHHLSVLVNAIVFSTATPRSKMTTFPFSHGTGKLSHLG